MSLALRALVGAVLGAFLVLMIHPAARPVILQGLWQFGPSRTVNSTRALPENLQTLPDPRSPQTGALTLLEAARRINEGQKLGTDTLLLMIEVCQAAGESEPDNAFWGQMESAFQARVKNDDAALKAWLRASLAQDFNDYQVPRLATIANDLGRSHGRQFAWHWGISLTKKSDESARFIAHHAERMVEQARQLGDLATLTATARNGRLLRDGARSVPAAEIGSQILNLAPGGTLTVPLGPRQAVDRRNEFLTSLGEAGLEQEYRGVSTAFTSDDAWHALIPADNAKLRRDILRRSVVSATLAGAMVLTGIISFALAGIGWLVASSQAVQRWLQGFPVALLGVGLGAAVYAVTGLAFPAIWTTIVLSGLAVSPRRVLSSLPKRMGFVFNFGQGLLALIGGLLMMILLMTSSTAAIVLQPALSFPQILVPGSGVLFAWFLVAVSFSLALSQVWAFVNQRRSPAITGLGLIRFGMTAGVAFVILGLAATPLMIAWDSDLGQQLERMFRNEPGYYFFQNPT